MRNRGSTPIFRNLVGVHPRNIHTKFETNPCNGLKEDVEKLKNNADDTNDNNNDDDNDGHRVIARVTLTFFECD